MALIFLAGADQRPNFAQLHKELITQVADKAGEVYRSLIDRVRRHRMGFSGS